MAATAPGTQSIDLVRQFTNDVFNGRDYDRIAELQTDDYVQYGPLTGMELHGTQEAIESMRMFHAAFSDLEATEKLQFSDEVGEYVCTLYTYRGTHDGDFIGIPPTDVEAEIPGIVINRIEDGKIAEGWVLADFLGLLQQIGVVPPMHEVAD